MEKFILLLLSAQTIHVTYGRSVRSISATTDIPTVNKFPADIGRSSTLSTRQMNGNMNLTPVEFNGGLQGSSLTVLRRGTDIIADSLVTALGGVASLINILQNFQQTGRLQFGNLSASTQLLTGRLINIGINAASSIIQQLGDGISGPGVSSGSGITPGSNQLFSTITTPAEQIGRQFGIAGVSIPQSLGLTTASNVDGLGGIFRQGLGAVTSRLQTGGSGGLLQSLGISGTEGNAGLSSLIQSVLNPLEASYATGIRPDVISGVSESSSPLSSVDSAQAPVQI